MLLAGGCGYTASPALLPPHLKTVAIPVFENGTPEAQLEQQVTDEVVQRFVRDNHLRIVDERGGISWLADQSKIPQPSLSRFFNTGSVPQRGTLLKLREALAPDGVALIEGWLSR